MQTLKQQQFDKARAESFGNRVVDILNSGALSLMISLGHRTGLFDTMMDLNPSTSQEIADRANLNERYVREWLGAMVVGDIVEYDPDARTYFLPKEHAVSLSRQSPAENLAVFAQYIPGLGQVEDDILQCFREGGGVPYEKFHRFHDVMAEDSGQSVLPALFDQILPLAPGVIEGLENGIEVLDLGCGRGMALMMMAEAYPESNFLGLDLSTDAIDWAQARAREKGLTNIRFEVADATYWNEHERYDLITTFDAIHDQAHPDKVLKNIYNALKPDGVYLMQDITASSHLHNNTDHPIAPLLYTVSCMHCMTVSLAQDGGQGLGTMWGEELAQQMLRDAGFGRIKLSHLPHDIQNTYYVITKT